MNRLIADGRWQMGKSLASRVFLQLQKCLGCALIADGVRHDVFDWECLKRRALSQKEMRL